ncbi:unnamed protein product [Prorocentrum cordatum]|nr:unnamed protein product [Polarella glacialis]
MLPWRGYARIAASVSNAAMIWYIYGFYLLSIDWGLFGQLQHLQHGESPRMTDYIWARNFDAAFKHLRLFSFSAAMLPSLDVYLFLGVPGSVVHLVLERDRVTWLQSFLKLRTPCCSAHRAARWLEMYYWSLVLGSLSFLMLARVHIDMSWPHYFCSASGLLFTTTALCLYLVMPFQVALVGADGCSEWLAQAKRWVFPSLWLVLGLTAMCFASALWKCERLGDDRPSLVFGVLETITITGYQLVLGVFVVDDRMMARTRVAPLKAD